MRKKEIFDLLDKIISSSNADETEVIFYETENALTRFANNRIHQNVAEKKRHILLRLYNGKKVGSAFTNKTDDESINELIQFATAQTHVQDDDPRYVPLPGPQEYRTKPNSYFEETNDLSPEQRAKGVIDVIKAAKRENLTTSGIFENDSVIRAQANSKGLHAFHKHTEGTFTTTMTSEHNSTGWASTDANDISQLNYKKAASDAIKKAKLGENPIEIKPGAYTVILEPQAVVDFCKFMSWLGFGALRYMEGRSFVSNKLGKKITGENINIWDNVYHPLSKGAPFDYEGMPKKKVRLVRNGIANAIVHDLWTAQQEDTESTGHAVPKPNTHGPIPMNVVIEGGDNSIQEMIESTRKGILITRFHYNRVVDPIRTIITGLTRDGTFLIENGKIITGIKNLRYNQSILIAFQNVEMMSPPVRVGNTVAPAMKIHDFHFSGVSGR